MQEEFTERRIEHTQGAIGQVKSIDRQRRYSGVDKGNGGLRRYRLLTKTGGTEGSESDGLRKASELAAGGLRSWRPGKALVVKRGSGVGWMRRPERKDEALSRSWFGFGCFQGRRKL